MSISIKITTNMTKNQLEFRNKNKLMKNKGVSL